MSDWFRSYLAGRTQTTSIDDYISAKHVIECRIPQGSVLGPLLFFLYINDSYKCSKVLKFPLFADDTNILYSNRNVKDLERVLNNEITKLRDWFIANKLNINIKQSNYVLFHPSRKKIANQINITLFNFLSNQDINLVNKKFIKYLGVLIALIVNYHANLILTH